MKANFKIKKTDDDKTPVTQEQKEMTEEEFENYIIKSGAAGSFMVFRNFKKKDDELGINEI